MKGRIVKHAIPYTLACAALAVLAGCGGSNDHSYPWFGSIPEAAKPTVTADELDTGAYTVSTGNAEQPTMGRYYAGADGKRLLALEDPLEHVDVLLRRADASSKWAAVPAPASDLSVKFLRSEARALAKPDAAALAGRYVVRLSDGSAADFQIGADGRIAKGSLSGCQLSGSLAAGSLPAALALSLDSSGCAGLPAHASGVLIVDSQDAPASLRLLADDGGSIVDLRGYAEPA